MASDTEPHVPVLVPFVCPVCAAQNGVHLISLSRSGGVDCAACGRWLKSADIVRAIHSPRGAQEGPSRTPVADAERKARIATKGGTPSDGPSKQGSYVWPPTAESRRAVKPLRKRA
jgi:hypothetical protein